MAENSKELPAAERFKIRRVEDIIGDTDLIHDLHRHDFFFILALQKGKAFRLAVVLVSFIAGIVTTSPRYTNGAE